MSQASAEEGDDRGTLEGLLVDLDREPLDLAEAIRWERERVMERDGNARDLERLELRFLERIAKDQRYGPELRSRVRLARHTFLAAELRRLRALNDAATIFDLAELRADFLQYGMVEESVAAGQILEKHIAEITEISDELREEAHERYAALATEEEDLSLGHKACLCGEMHLAFSGLHRRTGDKEMGRFARRLGRTAADRQLAMRLESVLTRRGAMILENVSLGFLLLVFVLLAVESGLPAGHQAIPFLQISDASICVFFITEFLFKLMLAPGRASWFLRNALTDLLPAIPAALWFFQPTGIQANTVWVRMLRLLRITWFARYVAALRPALRLVRLGLFLIKGLDSLVVRFSPLLNRNFIFFEEAVLPLPATETGNQRRVLFQALRREHILLTNLFVEEGAPVLEDRARQLTERLRGDGAIAKGEPAGKRSTISREIPIEHAIEFLHRLSPAELGAWLPRNDISAIDRLVRVVNAPLVRSLPIIRWLRSERRLPTEDERVVDLGKRIAILFERWRERALFFADMHGIVTGPQVLDRVASTMVLATKRPAIRLLLFGLAFLLIQMILGASSPLGQWLGRFVGTPLLVVGSVCLVFLTLGWWLKRLAGEAADTFKLTSEAHFIGLLELMKRRYQDQDLEFLGKRVFRWDTEPWQAAAMLANSIRCARTGHRPEGVDAPPELREEIERVSLLYLHFLDGAILHENDITTTQQLLANLSLENIRNSHLGFTKRDRKRLKRLSLEGGSIFSGPYVWFRFITESVAVETAKRITDYNRNCLTLVQRKVASKPQRQAFARWLRGHRREGGGRMVRLKAPGLGPLYKTTEFNALDFLTTETEREGHIARIFGNPVLQMMRRDRQRMIREIFGTKPLHELPSSKRSINFYSFYQQRLSGGRAIFLPFYTLRRFYVSVAAMIGKTMTIIREIMTPEKAEMNRELGRASFAVALRKIHRMKAPTLVEAMRLRVAFDPAYCGAPPGWCVRREMEPVSELEKDMDFLMLRTRDRQDLRELAAENRQRIQELHNLVHRYPEIASDDEPPELKGRGERAVSIAYMTDRLGLRSLFNAEEWFESSLRRMESGETALPSYCMRRTLSLLLRGFRRHPIDRWLRECLPNRRVSWRGRGNFRRAWHADEDGIRATVRVWRMLEPGRSPGEEAMHRARQIYLTRDDISRELAALRTVQSLSILDMRNYRKLVFDLGNYAGDGENPSLAEAVP